MMKRTSRRKEKRSNVDGNVEKSILPGRETNPRLADWIDVYENEDAAKKSVNGSGSLLLKMYTQDSETCDSY